MSSALLLPLLPLPLLPPLSLLLLLLLPQLCLCRGCPLALLAFAAAAATTAVAAGCVVRVASLWHARLCHWGSVAAASKSFAGRSGGTGCVVALSHVAQALAECT